MSDVQFTLGVDDAGGIRQLDQFRKAAQATFEALKKPGERITVFNELQQQVDATGKALTVAKNRVRDLAGELIRVDSANSRTAASLREVTANVRTLESNAKALDRLQFGQANLVTARDRVRDLGNELARAAEPSRDLQQQYQKAVDAYRALQRSVQRDEVKLQGVQADPRALQAARAQMQQLTAEQQRSQVVLRQLQGDYRNATRELDSLTARAKTQGGELGRLRNQLQAAGVDTTRLAAEQMRLRKASAQLGIARLAAEQRRAQVAARDLSLQQARSNLGVTQARAAQQAIADLRRQYELLRTSGSLTTRELAIAQQQLNVKIAQAKNELRGLQGGSSSGRINALAARGSGALAATGGIAGLALAGRAYAQALDPIKKMEAQLKLATSSQEEFNRAQQETFRIAQENQAPLEDVVGLYARLAPALKEAGRPQADAIKIIDAVTKSLRISGATAEETASTIQQFSQALGSGVLRGEEFNTLAESSPRLLKALADGLNVNVGALRNMAAEGKLTANVIADALVGQLPKLNEEAKQLPETWSGAVTKFKNEWSLMLDALDDFTGASSKVVGGINSVANAMARIRSGEFADFFRSKTQTAGGIKNEMSVLLSQIRDLQTARAGLSRTDSTDTFFFKFKFYDRAEADAAIKALEGDLEKLKARLREVEGLEKESNAKREEEEKAASEQRRKLKEQAYQDDKKLLEQSLKDAKASLAARVAEERKAASALEKLQQEKLDTQTRYQDALAKLQSGGAGSDPSYGAASAMKVAARNALRAGDVEGAKRQAQAALSIIQQLAESGQNTWGFEGFVKDLQAIEQAADQKGITEAQAKLDAAKASVAELQAQVDKLAKVKVTPEMSAEDRAKLLTDVQELARVIGNALTISPTITPVVSMPSGAQLSVSNSDIPRIGTIPGHANGTASALPGWAWVGENGPELLRMRGGEQVLPSGLSLALDSQARNGGLARNLPEIPQVNSQAMQPANPLEHWGAVDLGLPGGGSAQVLVHQKSMPDLLRLQARMRGSKR